MNSVAAVATDAAEVVARNLRAFTDRDLEGGPGLMADGAPLVDVPTGRTFVGPVGQRAYWAGWTQTMSDASVEIVRCQACADGRTVVAEFVGSGTMDGPMALPDGRTIPPSGRTGTTHFCQVATVDDGLITSTTVYYDALSFLAQLGVL